MRTRLDRWGNSLGVRIPKALADEAGLREGDHVEIDVEKGAVVMRRGRPRYTLDELLEGVTPENHNVDRDWIEREPVGRERFWEDE
jgi:antitoxin MazE